MKVRTIIILLGLCLLGLLLSGCGDMQTGVDYLMTGNADSQQTSGSTDYRSLARQDAIDASIPSDKFVTQIQMESGFNPQAKSPMGAEGIAQIMPDTAKSWNVDPWNPSEALNVAAQHMAWYQTTYGGFDKALAAYNGGVGRLVWSEQNCSYWLNCEYPETIRYVRTIMG